MAEREKQYNYSCTNVKGMWLSISSRQQQLITELSWFLWEQEKKNIKNISWQSMVITMESWWTIKDTINHLRHAVSSMQLWTGSYLCSDLPFGWAPIGELVWRESADIVWREPSAWILSPVPAAVMTAVHSVVHTHVCVCVHVCMCAHVSCSQSSRRSGYTNKDDEQCTPKEKPKHLNHPLVVNCSKGHKFFHNDFR